MEKNSVDNVTVTFIAFKNFENKMKDDEFQYKEEPQCKFIGNEIDFDYKENLKINLYF